MKVILLGGRGEVITLGWRWVFFILIEAKLSYCAFLLYILISFYCCLINEGTSMIVLHILVVDDTFITSPLGEGMFEKFVSSILCFVDVGGGRVWRSPYFMDVINVWSVSFHFQVYYLIALIDFKGLLELLLIFFSWLSF